MADKNVDMADDAFAATLESLKNAADDVGRYMAKTREIECELENWKKLNPKYLEDEELRYLYENKKKFHKASHDLLNQTYDRLDKANYLLREKKEHCFQLNEEARQVVPFDNCVPESFRGMTSIQSRQQGSQEALVSLPHQKSSIAYKKESLGALDAEFFTAEKHYHRALQWTSWCIVQICKLLCY
jgi:hypothetical protein